MPPTVLQFPMTNPFVTGMQTGAQTAGQMIQNQYAPGLLQQQLQQAALQNQMLAAKAQYSQPLALAALQQAQKQQQLTGAEAQQAAANAALLGQHAQVLQGQKPYLIQQEQSKLFADPMLQRLYELQLAQKYGLNTSPLGFNNQQQQVPQNGANPANPVPVTGGNPQQSGSAGAFDPNAQQNFLRFGTVYSPFQYAQQKSAAEAAGKTGVEQYKTAIADAQQEGEEANNLNQLSHQYATGYANSTYKGGVLGKITTTGLESIPARIGNAITGKGDLAPEQETDIAANNMAAMMLKLWQQGRITNMEYQSFLQNKPNRSLDAPASQQMVNFVQQKAVRMQEKLPFLQAAQNAGVDAPTAQTLWNQYQQQRPVYDFSKNQPNTQYINSWKDYLTPKMIQAAQAGNTATPKGGIAPQNSPPSGNAGNFQPPQFKNQQDFIHWYTKVANDQERSSMDAIIAQNAQKSQKTKTSAPQQQLPLTQFQINRLKQMQAAGQLP